MNNFVTSQIRTFVPIAIGYLITLLAKNFDILIDENTEAQLVAAFSSIAAAVYYAVVRVLERKFPQFGWLLGSKSQPIYANPETTPKRVLE